MSTHITKHAILAVMTTTLRIAASAAIGYGSLWIYREAKAYGRAHQLGPWTKDPSLDAWDPQERVEAARSVARTYGRKSS